MMVRTQISLTEEQHRSAHELAERLDVSMSEVFRRALERFVVEEAPPCSAISGLRRIAGTAVRRADALGDDWDDHDEAFVRSIEVRKGRGLR